MEVVELNNGHKDQYHNFLINSPHKDILQSWLWGEIKSKVNWKVKRLGFFKKGILIGTAQILERKLFAGLSLFYVPRGPITDWDNLNLAEELLDSLKEFFLKKIKNRKTLFLRLEPPVEKKEDLREILEKAGFKKYFKTVQPPSTLLIDLTSSEEELFKNFRRTARNLIYRSEKEGVIIDALERSQITQNHLRGFYNLYRETGKRFSFPLRPFKQFALLLEAADYGHAVRMYIAKAKGLVLAYGLVLVLGDKAFYIWGGTGRHEYYSKFFNYGYIWGMLKELKKIGVKTFDFWGLGPLDNKNHPWYGFSLFKTAFGGRRFNYIGAFDLPVSKFYPAFKIVDRIITPKYRAES